MAYHKKISTWDFEKRLIIKRALHGILKKGISYHKKSFTWDISHKIFCIT